MIFFVLFELFQNQYGKRQAALKAAEEIAEINEENKFP